MTTKKTDKPQRTDADYIRLDEAIATLAAFTAQKNKHPSPAPPGDFTEAGGAMNATTKRLEFVAIDKMHHVLAYLLGATIEEAANHAAVRLYGRKAFAQRTTGTAGLSGWFQAYRTCEGSGTWNATSIGDPFHVSAR